jgi:copper chaperone
VGTLTKALAEALPGSAVNIDLASHRVEFTGNKARGEEAIREAGYTPEAA